MTSWTIFCKKFADENNISYKDAMRTAGPYYSLAKQGRKQMNTYGGSIINDDSMTMYNKGEDDAYFNKRYSAALRKKITEESKEPIPYPHNKKLPRQMRNKKNLDLYNAGVLIGGVLSSGKTPKGALAALLSGLNANVKVPRRASSKKNSARRNKY